MTNVSTELRIPAAQYIRMSTDHQRYSLENQVAVIAEYAERRGFAIVQTYTDAGKSGLTLKGRDGLRQLLSDVVTGQRTYSAILVLDVSRWGRFQDTDQSAHYEFLCREAGVAVKYCGEAFENDGSMVSTIVKNLKRVMAGEYSRELSEKVSRAHKQQARLGYKQGGQIPYGIRRLLVSKEGRPRFILGFGEEKGVSTDRVVFAPGPNDEIRTVRQIFRMFVGQNQNMSRIARELNGKGITSTNGAAWTSARVRTVLTSELMIGYYVYNRETQRMKAPAKRNPPGLWIRTRVMKSIVGTRQFAKARQQMERRSGYAFVKQDMIDRLQRLLKEKGKLSSAIIDCCRYTPSSRTYAEHFGGLRTAYATVGYECRWRVPKRRDNYSDDQLLDGIRRLHATFGYVTIRLIEADPDLPKHQMFTDRFGSIMRAYGLAGFPTTKRQAISAARKRALSRC
ncbi:recombinase family protein [Mesorhizobium sp. M4B.F.Ca.ET.169.01.1.1]|uniref:recombinase family protein n=1 Tax=unclassified Mesorhizobium TaxID=325217 RepID=UPI0010937D1A|nr:MULTISPECIES: recombinase family protein [unclassified Mesorhizobium]TGT37102.1 recombinase family protein [Mesorhizobium sp. M4B.F.Ca.ET.169.01.1.1]TIU72443.1 MAG: recombinase family protein [Mesorhizobium sp.]TIW08560.1 MAG: recombinase family protein [Mesorhizobium sp.]TIX70658.1 MAG: recombinase family protein [Mesorhizobium sp.]